MSLKVQVDDILRRREKLKTFEPKAEINAYCDQLEYEVTSTAQALNEQIKRNRDDLLNAIDSYRKDLLLGHQSRSASAKSEFIKANQEMKEISQEIDQLGSLWESIRSGKSNEELFKVQENAFDLTLKTKNIEHRLRKQVFNDKYLRFVRKGSLSQPADHLGKLELTTSRDDNSGNC